MYLDTNRLVLKDYSIENLQDYYSLKSCEEVWKYSTNSPENDIDVIKNQLKELIENQKKYNFGFCSLFEKASNNYVGEAGILSMNRNANRCVIGYNILPPFWNKGYATEITKEIVRYAFNTLEFERVEALALQLNVPSCKVLEKSGLIKEGVLKHFARIDQCYYDVAYFGVIRSDYNAK